jgi:hypothetical protein
MLVSTVASNKLQRYVSQNNNKNIKARSKVIYHARFRLELERCRKINSSDSLASTIGDLDPGF